MGRSLVNCLDFDNDGIFHHEIHFVSAIQFDPLVRNRQMNLPLKTEAQLTQLITETFFINRFHQSRPQLPMHLDGRANDLLGQSIHA